MTFLGAPHTSAARTVTRIVTAALGCGGPGSDEDFKERLKLLNEELETLNADARELEETVSRNVADLLDA